LTRAEATVAEKRAREDLLSGLKLVRQKLGLRLLSHHKVGRHSVASQAVTSGESVKAVQAQLGHRSEQSTHQYAPRLRCAAQTHRSAYAASSAARDRKPGQPGVNGRKIARVPRNLGQLGVNGKRHVQGARFSLVFVLNEQPRDIAGFCVIFFVARACNPTWATGWTVPIAVRLAA
jgi:hypothetical protein